MENKERRYSVAAFCLLIIPTLVYWASFQIQSAINVDIAFLTQSAQRLLDGMVMSEGFYDTNPPLSIIVYLPPAFLVKYLGTAMDMTVFWYDFMLVVFSALLVHYTLKPLPSLSYQEKILTVTIYLLANTLAAQLYMGEKDQYIILGLFPFMLVQICITHEYYVPKFQKYLALCSGAFFVMLKPHFYIIPFAILAHRAITQKRWNLLKDQDFVLIILFALLYGITIIIFFPDFPYEILPSILALYVNVKEEWVLPLSMVAGLVGILFALTAWFLPKRPQKYAALFFMMFTLCLVPFIIQGKGYFYHAIPSLVFFCTALALLLHAFISESLEKFSKKNAQFLASLVTVLLFITGFWHIFGSARYSITGEQYKNTILAQKIMECQESCSFYMFNDMTEMIHQLSVYTGQTHASRFPSFWFLPKLLEKENTSLSEEQKKELIEKFSLMVAQDLERYSPHILIIGNFYLTDDKEPFNFIDFFGKSSPEFLMQIGNYQMENSIVVDQKVFFPETLFPSTPVAYDIYRRKIKKSD